MDSTGLSGSEAGMNGNARRAGTGSDASGSSSSDAGMSGTGRRAARADRN
jgi:hypothetical protein